MKSKLGELKSVLNTARPNFSRSDRKYFSVWVQKPDGAYQALLLTDHEIGKATVRAWKNDEDVPELKISLLARLTDVFNRMKLKTGEFLD